MNKKYISTICCAFALLAGAGCGGGGNSPNQQTAQTLSVTQTTTGSYRGVGFNLVVPRRVKSGQPLIMQFTATNNRDTVIDYDSGHTKNTEVIVRQNGAVIYDSAQIPITADGLPAAHLQPKGSLVMPETWLQITSGGDAVGPGTYSVQVFFVPNDDFIVDAKGYVLNESEKLLYGAPPVDVVVTP